MRRFLLLLSIAFTASAAAADTSRLSFFYCIHAGRPCSETTAVTPVGAEDVPALARRVLSTKDDFIGFVDGHETTLQFYVEDIDSILVDMPVPQMKGSYATHVNRAQALKLIAGLSPPLSRYRATLGLKFAKWK